MGRALAAKAAEQAGKLKTKMKEVKNKKHLAKKKILERRGKADAQLNLALKRVAASEGNMEKKLKAYRRIEASLRKKAKEAASKAKKVEQHFMLGRAKRAHEMGNKVAARMRALADRKQRDKQRRMELNGKKYIADKFKKERRSCPKHCLGGKSIGWNVRRAACKSCKCAGCK